jgi:hypothetical protein
MVRQCPIKARLDNKARILFNRLALWFSLNERGLIGHENLLCCAGGGSAPGMDA